METQETQERAPHDAHAIAALVLGILSVISPFQVIGLGPLVGVIFGVIALYQASISSRNGENSLAHSGKVLAIIGVVVSTLALIAVIIILVQMGNMMHAYWTFQDYTYTIPRMTQFHRLFWF